MVNYRSIPVDLDCELKDSTEKAWLIVIDDEDYWVPKSISEFAHDYHNSVTGIITVPTWWAEQNDLA